MTPRPAHPEANGYKRWTKEGIRDASVRPKVAKPPHLDAGQVAELSEDERWDWLDACHRWHANIPALPIPRYTELQHIMRRAVDSNRQEDASVKNGIILDAPSTLGKTRTTLDEMYEYQRRVTRNGKITHLANGCEFVPFIFLTLSEKTTAKGFNKDLHRFVHAPAKSGTAEDIGIAAAGHAIDCGVKVVVVDDYHFLASKTSVNAEMGNHLKFLMSIIPATFILVGVNVESEGLLNEDLPVWVGDTQTGRRFTPQTLKPFALEGEPDDDDWWLLLSSFEDRLVLPGAYDGMLADDLHDYLHDRTGGYIGGLTDLLRLGCWEALDSGENKLTQSLLDSIDINYLAEIHAGRRTLTRG